jgi:hypothetical protein
MNNGTGIKTEVGGIANSILFYNEPKVAVSAVIGDTGVSAGSDGKKIIKAGTPLTGDLTARNTPFLKASSTAGVAKSLAKFSLLVTHAAGADGNVSIQLGYRSAVNVALVALTHDTAAKVATAIAAATFVGWTAAKDPDNDAKVIFTAVDPGEQPSPIVGYASTQVTGTLATVNAGGVEASAAASNVVALALHDTDVTSGSANAPILLAGYVNSDKLGTATAALITAEVKAALAGRILFLK